MKIICPYCNQSQKKEAKKTWSYGKMIEKRTKSETVWGASINCSQYYCECGKPFRFYLTSKGKFWTIPKSKIESYIE
jgi:hypothetical protein